MLDIAFSIDVLVPGADYQGSVTDNTEAAFNALRWNDARPKPTWAEVSAIEYSPTPDMNGTLETAFMQMLPAHLGQPYCTAAVIREVMQTKVAVIDANRIDPTGSLARSVIEGTTLPEEMGEDKQAILAMIPGGGA